jgi:membrane protein DedA with SNARE-associated domain
MTLQAIIEHYGYVAIGIGTFAEGETILVLGGFAAHRGFLELPWVIVSAFIGSLAGDQLFFFLGRFRGQAILAKHPVWQIRAAHAQRLLDRYRIPVILGFRFMYGLRTVTPFVLGMGRVPTIEFVVLNVIAALVWAAAVATAGYLFGGA